MEKVGQQKRTSGKEMEKDGQLHTTATLSV